ncbi:unnamed protein product, partial [Mycena citricolor]
ALERAGHHVPRALVDDERRLSVITSVLVGLRDDPGGSVRNAEVQNLALHHEVVQSVHDLFDAGVPVPPVQVQDVDVFTFWAYLSWRALYPLVYWVQLISSSKSLESAVSYLG